MLTRRLMLTLKRATLGVALAVGTVGGLHAAAADPDPIPWTRETATQALSWVDRAATVQALTDLTLAGADADLLLLLDATRSRGDWPAPVRDAAIFEYARGLAELPADAVPPSAMRFLERYDALTWVPHDDHAHGRVPLLNVRAAARGIENGWLRQEARLEGMALLRARPGSLLDAWLIESHPAVRAGYLEALAQATPARIAAVSEAAARRLPGEPGLTALAGRAALLANDDAGLAAVLEHGEGAALQHVMQALPVDDPARVQRHFEAALGSRSEHSAALAIALLYPALAGTHAADAALLARLGDDTLGAAAALALARSPARDTQLALEALAATPDRPAARRAQLALAVRADVEQEDPR